MTGRGKIVRARVVAVIAVATLSSGCNTLNRLSHVGDVPPMTQIQNPTSSPAYRPVTMPMPNMATTAQEPNSLWRSGSRSFFKDQRANEVGDILTVLIEIADKAEINNTTKRTRTNTEDASVNAMFGYESSLTQVLPEQIDPGNLIDVDSASSAEGTGEVLRKLPDSACTCKSD